MGVFCLEKSVKCVKTDVSFKVFDECFLAYILNFINIQTPLTRGVSDKLVT